MTKHGLTEAKRFWLHVTCNSAGCWIWTGAITSSRYGSFKADGKMVLAHRWAYEQANGPIPAGLTLDHLCRTRSCVRASHLEAVTMRENLLRGESPSAVNARKTHCIRGHEFNEANTRIRPHGRGCRACSRQQQRRAQHV